MELLLMILFFVVTCVFAAAIGYYGALLIHLKDKDE
jgi:hypothetical protein